MNTLFLQNAKLIVSAKNIDTNVYTFYDILNVANV